MKKHVVFKKGQKVKISRGMNASKFNKGSGCGMLGAYGIDNWEDVEFTIEGTVKLISFSFDPTVYGAYLLLYHGFNVGYVYNTGIRPVIDSE